jgi:LmbE family N-acetylglucosaminyl deacetylase
MGPGDGRARIAVDTTATVDRKVAALMCHKSQLPDPDAIAERVRNGARAQAAAAGLPDGSSAELFRVTRIP